MFGITRSIVILHKLKSIVYEKLLQVNRHDSDIPTVIPKIGDTDPLKILTNQFHNRHKSSLHNFHKFHST